MEHVERIQERGTLLDLVRYLLEIDRLLVFGPQRAHGFSCLRMANSFRYTLLMRRAETSYLQYHIRH